MKRLFTTCVFAIVGWAIGTWAAATWLDAGSTAQSTASAPPGPRIVLPSVHCDLGTVPSGAPIVARFDIKNVGSRRLIVRRENTACCGQAPIDEMITVPPAGSAELVVKFDAGRKSGRLEEAVVYNTNDQALPRFELNVSAYIREPEPLATKENRKR